MRPRRRARFPSAGYETQLTSKTSALSSLSQVSLLTEEELGACPELSNVVPPWCLKYLEGDHRKTNHWVFANRQVVPWQPPRLSRGLKSVCLTE